MTTVIDEDNKLFVKIYYKFARMWLKRIKQPAVFIKLRNVLLNKFGVWDQIRVT